jgi:23S rRNA (guanosine2251-2'-O)-methyltransferase
MDNIYIVLEDVRSLYNIGAIFRTCSFFGFSKVILVGYSGKNTKPNGEVVLHDGISKSSLGSEKDLEIIFMEDAQKLVDFVRQNSLSLMCLEQHPTSTDIKDLKHFENSVLVLGNEVTGVSDTLMSNAQHIVEIKRTGNHNSLNITTACGIALHHLRSVIGER